MDFNLADLVESVADVHPQRTALVCAGVRRSYAELEERANRVAHALLAAGLPEQGHVGIQMLNGCDYAELLLGTLKARLVPVNVNYRYVQEELRYLYNDADLVALVVAGEFADRAAAVAPEVPTLRQVFVVDDGTPTGPLPASWLGWETALAAASPDRDFGPRSPDDLFIIYTGGTTGMPKGVMWRQEDIFFAGMGGGEPMGEPARKPTDVAERALGKGELVMFPTPPLMHGAAMLATFIAWLQGGAVVYVPRFDAADVLDVAAAEGANSLMLVGDAMARPLGEELARRAAEGRPVALPSLFAISSAGAILSETVRSLITEHLPSVLILDNYGASETGFNGSAAPGSSPEAGLRFTVNARTAVLGEDLVPVVAGSGQVGRIAQRGHVPLGYYGDPVKTAETFVVHDGERWVLLGDLATVDDDGVIALLGRASAMINSGGEKIFPEEVEAALKSHPAVFDAVVAGRRDDRFGEVVAAVIQARDGVAPPTLADLQAHLAARVARYKVPRHVVVVEQLRRSPSGKADYPWARQTVNS